MVKLDGVSEISDYESSDNNILHKTSQIQELICDQYISKDKKKQWYSHPVNYSAGRTS